jgi:hypothetical protein
VADDAETLRCNYCGITFDLDPGPAAAPAVMARATPLPAAPRATRWSQGCWPILLVGLAAGYAFHLSTQNRARHLPIRPAALADLGTAVFQPLDVPPPPGGYAALEPMKALPWILGVAQAWRKDAVLVEARWLHLRPDGTLDLAQDDGARISYVFVAPTNRQARFQGRAGQVANTLELTIHLGQLQATLSKGADRSGTLPTCLPDPSLSLLQCKGGALGNGKPYLTGGLEWDQGSWMGRVEGEAFRLKGPSSALAPAAARAPVAAADPEPKRKLFKDRLPSPRRFEHSRSHPDRDSDLDF